MTKQLTLEFGKSPVKDPRPVKHTRKKTNDYSTTSEKKSKMAIKAILQRIETAKTKADNISTEVNGNWTNKRQREADKRRKDKEHLEKCVQCLTTLKAEWENGSVPNLLEKVRSVGDIEFILKQKFPVITPDTYEYRIDQIKKDSKKADRMGITTETEWNTAKKLIHERMVIQLSPEEQKKRDIEAAINEVRKHDIPGFFPTPDELIYKMIDYAKIHQDGVKSFLEPSAGIGNIVDIIREIKPDAQIVCCEIHPVLSDVLKKKGYTVPVRDMHHLVSMQEFDRIIMNPPFEKKQDIEHISYCFENHLKDGGILVSIASSGTMHRSQKKDIEFREFVNKHGNFIELEGGEFKGSFNNTGVSTCIVVLRK